MKRILQAMDSAATKPVAGANEMSRFLRAVTEAELNQPAPAATLTPQQDPNFAKYTELMAKYDMLSSEMAPDTSGLGVEKSASPEFIQQVNNLKAQADALAGPNAQAWDQARKAGSAPQQTNAQLATNLKETDISKFLYIVNKNDVSVLNEGANPHKVSLPVQMAMQHYQQATPIEKSKSLAGSIGKHFHDVEQELTHQNEYQRQLINQYASSVAERVLMKESVAKGLSDTIYPNAEVIKSKNGKPVGEIYQDGNSWGAFHYRADRGYDFIDSREEAIEALKDLHQETGRSRPDYTVKGVAEAIPLGTLRSAGTRVKDEVSARLKQNGTLGRDDPFGPEGRFVGDTGPAQITTTVARVQLKPGDKVLYKPTEQRARIEAMSRDGTQARIHIPSPMGGKTFNCKVADLRATGQGIEEGDVGKHNNKTTGFKALAKKAGGGEKGARIAGAQFQKMKKAGQLEGSLNEYAAGGGADGNYFRELASAWYNGTFDSGSLQKGIKSQQDVERLLQLGVIAKDGKMRKYHIDYNGDFDGVEIYSDDYYEYADHDDTIDSRTGQKWGPYDYMEFSDDELSEDVAEDISGQSRGFKPGAGYPGIQSTVSEAPLDFDKNNPMASRVHSHAKANSASIEYRIMRARSQLTDLAQRAQSNELLVWEGIASHFPELAMNIEQIRHGIEELSTIRKIGGRRTGNIPKEIGEGSAIQQVNAKRRTLKNLNLNNKLE